MKKFLIYLVFIMPVIALSSGNAIASPFPDNVANDVYSGVVNGTPTARDDNDGTPDIYNAVKRLLGTTFTSNKNIDSLFIEPDYTWTQLDSGVALIGLTAGYSNTLGVYDPLNPDSKMEIIGPYSGFKFLGDGTFENPYPAAAIPENIVESFGFYLKSVPNSGNPAYYYSEPSLNPFGWDHMMTFDLGELEGQSIWLQTPESEEEPFQHTFVHPYLLAWEDLPWNGQTLGDEDYDDMIYLFDVAPVPEPTTMLLLGSGLIGLGVFGRRKFFKKS